MSSISIVVPAYNEERRLPACLTTVLAYLESRNYDFAELIVVNDGSSDATRDLVRQAARENPIVRLVENGRNRGKGYAVRNGMLHARGDWRLFSDADLSTPIDQLDRLLEIAEKQNAAVVIGSRTDPSLINVHQSTWREYSGRFFNLVMRALTGLPFEDTQCGFKLYRADAAQQIFSRQLLEGFSFDVEDLYIATRLGFRCVDIPVPWSNVEGTKVTALRGVQAFLDLLRVRLNAMEGKYRNGSKASALPD